MSKIRNDGKAAYKSVTAIYREELQIRKEHTAISEKRASLIRCYCLFGYLLEVNYCAKYLTAHRNYPYNNQT